jgi:hypothetical protein
MAAVGDDAGKVGADLGFHVGDDGRECVAAIGIARQRLYVGDELSALGRLIVVATEILTPNS